MSRIENAISEYLFEIEVRRYFLCTVRSYRNSLNLFCIFVMREQSYHFERVVIKQNLCFVHLMKNRKIRQHEEGYSTAGRLLFPLVGSRLGQEVIL